MTAQIKENEWNLMIAEDDDDDYLIFEVALEKTTILYKLTRAVDGEILIKLLSDNIPDILFLDLLMPCKDGHQCIQEIRADKRYDQLPVIVYSSRSDSPSIDRCYRGGANFFTIKPDSVNDLTSVLQHLLSINWKTHLFYPTKDGFVLNANKRN